MTDTTAAPADVPEGHPIERSGDDTIVDCALYVAGKRQQ
ncbi:MAG: hypothetical protein QOI51_1879, partial [Nocardioidaceae bacterium]|nr:hypothetical protein [Nocardioidaceae bacterium]